MKKTLTLLLLLAGLSGEVRAETLIWNGSWNDMTWNTENGNWLLNGAHAVYANGNDVVFGDTGNGYVSLSGELAPSSVLVKSDNYYFFCDDIGESNKLTGTMQLTKEGEGKLTIQTANDYRGGTLIKGGTLQMGNENALGSGDVTLMGGTLNLGGCTLSNNVNVNGSAHIANGTVSGNLNLADNVSFTWEEGSFLELTGSITLGEKATLDLGKHTLPENVILNGYDTYIGNGSINHDLAVERGALYLAGNIDGTGNIILGSGAKLRLAGYTLSNSVTLKGNAVVGGGTLDSNLTVGKSQTLIIEYDLKGKGNIILADDSALFLFNSTLSNSVILNEKARIEGVGTISGDFILADNASFSWEKGSPLDSVQLTGNIALGERTVLDLGSKTLSNNVNVTGSRAYIGGGDLSGDLTIGAGNTLELYGNITGTGVISLEAGAYLRMEGQTLSGSIKLGKHSDIDAYLGSSNTTIKTRESADSALLEKVSVSDGLIAGTDRQASLADGLYIKSEANLLIESMTITANNEIYVGDYTITLNQVTIDLSKAEYKLVDSNYYFQLQDLINCKLEMDDVVFDASGLELPTGFNPGVNGIGIDFGDDVTIDKETANNLTLLMGGNWSQTMSIDEQGRPVFTALVPTPEPATSTLSLLALCALAARRRRK